jgi:hypothetical protein
MPLRELYQRLRDTYCGSVGVEYMHIDDIEVRRWLQRRLEPMETRMSADAGRAVADSHAPDRRGDVRGVHPEEVRGGEEFFAGGV